MNLNIVSKYSKNRELKSDWGIWSKGIDDGIEIWFEWEIMELHIYYIIIRYSLIKGLA